MRKSLALWSVVLLGSMGAFAQTEIGLPSPTAANLGKMADEGISMFTGKPNITIPITSIGSGDIGLGISLSYHASGVKVSEIPDWAGAGWALSAGGVVTRMVKGFPDELEKGYISAYTQERLSFFEARAPGGITDGSGGTPNETTTVDGLNALTIANDIKNNLIDSEPDVFYYNFGGMGGKFILEPGVNKTGIAIPQSDLTIEFTSGNGSANGQFGTTILSFTITTSAGVTYTFEELEYAMREPGAVVTKFDPAKAWYLTEVSSASGEHNITLSYSTSEQVIHKFNNEEYETNSVAGDEHYFQFLNRIYLEEIVSKDRKVVFSRGERNDTVIPSEWSSYPGYSSLKKEQRLESIEVRTGSGVLIKEFVLTPAYDSHNYRMFLGSVQEFDNEGHGLPAYTFTYHSINELPDRLSKGIDHWGFYNGKESYNANKGFISEGVWFNHFLAPSGEFVFHVGADRRVDTTKTKFGVLENITYPTGGSVTYKYEQNVYSEVIHESQQNLNAFNKTRVIIPETNLTDIQAIEAESFSDDGVGPVYVVAELYYTCNGSYLDLDKLFIEESLNSSNGGHFKMNYTLDDPGYTIVNNLSCQDFETKFGPVTALGVKVGEKKIPLNLSGSGGNTFDFRFYERDGQHNGQNGADGSTPDEATVNYYVYGAYNSTFTNAFGPGLRVAKRTLDDGNAATSNIVRSYSYTDDVNGVSSSGVMYNEPAYLKLIPELGSLQDTTVISGPTVSQQNSFGMGEKGFAGYYRVIETVGGNGETETVFYLQDQLTSTASGHLTELDEYYSSMIKSNSNVVLAPYFGKPKEVRVYDNFELDLQHFSNTENKTDTLSNHSLLQFFAIAKDSKILGSSNNAFFQPYYISIPFVANTKRVTKVFDPSGKFHETITETEYEGTTHKNPTKVTETNSLSSEKRVTTYKYAHEQDGSSGSPDYSAMATANMLTQPYSVLTEDANGADVSKSWTIWNNGITGAASGAWLLKEHWVWDGSGVAPAAPSTSTALKTSEVLEYDSYGNPLEIQSGTGSTASVTKAFYGSNTQPFQNATTTGNAVNGVLGVYLTGIQKVNGTEDAITGGVRPVSGDDLFSVASYDGIGRVISKTDENEQRTSYGYDSFHRLITQTNANGMIVGATGYGYSAQRNAGSFASDDPNNVQQITYLDPFYATDFTTNEGWTGTLSEATFDYDFHGEKTVRLGNTSGTTNFRRNSTVTDFVVRTDYYASSVLTGHPHVFMFNNGNPGLDTSRRFSIQYVTATDEFRIVTRQYGDTDYIFHTAFPMDAAPNTWYTFEIEKKGDTITGWVYPRGSTRSEANSLSYSGYNTSWKPTMYFQTAKNYVYLSNFSMAKATQSSVSYLDGLGREIQTQVRGGNKVIATETLYNDRGLPEVAARPIETTATAFPGYYTDGLLRGGSPFTVGNAIPPASPVHTYYGSQVALANDEDYAYAQTQYEASPLARVEKSTLPGTTHRMGQGKEVETSYGLNTTESFTINGKTWGLNSLSKTVSKDPEGNETITYTNGWGQTIVSGVNMNPTVDDVLDKSTPDLVTYFEYDARGNLVRVEDPRGLATTYSYNTLGQLVEKELPDQEEANSYCYDDKGRLRFHRDPNHVANVSYYYQSPQYDYHYTKYDDLDRPIETGEKDGLGSYTTACSAYANTQTYPSGYHTPKVYYSYDGTDAATGARNYAGRLTKVKYMESLGYMSTPIWGETWYSYNSLGLVEWIVHSIPGLTGDIKITYDYDELGRQTKMGYNVTNALADHYYWYEYDELGRLEYVYSDTDSDEAGRIKEAEYTNYTADGQVTQMKLGNSDIQTVDYQYTVQGWLDQINQGSVGSASTSDKFGMDLAYKLNGNIESQQWKQAEISTSYFGQYTYSYDGANQLSGADFSDNSPGYDDNDNGYDVSYGYDANGNMTSLTRKGKGAYMSTTEPYESLSNIVIPTGVGASNRLSSYSTTTGSGAATPYTVLYDANGNMIQNRFTSAAYNERNLMTQVTKGSTTVKFGYDGEGNRVRKEVVNGVETHYVRGADGQTIAVYEDGALEFVNLLAGGQILGTYDGSQRRYFLKDHLGTVRTTVDETGAVDGYDDYYPFGLVMDGRSNNTANPNDNYKFTGHELDDEVGLNIIHMNARGMDPVLGRFLQIDPMLQYSSPYTYVGNNPLLFNDPTGMLGDYFDGDGNHLGSDGINDKKIYIANEGESKSVKKSLKKGEIGKAKASSTQAPSMNVLLESIGVLDRTKKNGGNNEESSKVMTGSGPIVRGETGPDPYVNDKGLLVATSELPDNPNNSLDFFVEAIIHSHPLNDIPGPDGGSFLASAISPSPLDNDVFSSFKTNIIVGPLGNGSKFPNGLAIYNSKSELQLTIKASTITKIVTKILGVN